ncbi:hypothetical protein ACH5RR_022871 [Cinchona calisaya]|uniref:Uncharacterized protein n=1 Tax=Cinchona calisaya TaxID=153742 RepID=A0ABD2Z937_9GENT
MGMHWEFEGPLHREYFEIALYLHAMLIDDNHSWFCCLKKKPPKKPPSSASLVDTDLVLQEFLPRQELSMQLHDFEEHLRKQNFSQEHHSGVRLEVSKRT